VDLEVPRSSRGGGTIFPDENVDMCLFDSCRTAV
jgi:hypothetical protein